MNLMFFFLFFTNAYVIDDFITQVFISHIPFYICKNPKDFDSFH